MKPTIGNRRRDFLKKISAATLAATSIPALAFTADRKPLFPNAPGTPDESYWALVKSQFAVPDNLIMCNAANLCPAPYAINQQVLSFQQSLSRDVSFQYRALFPKLRAESISMLADFVGVSAAEIGITRNTSESNCILVNGLDFKAGDQIILWDQNHPSNKESWLNKAKRNGLVIKMVAVPAAPKSATELLTPFLEAITDKTRLISFSHISNISGIALPAREICSLARSRGILSLIDGAQSLGFLNLNLKELGCDFYTASTHKWLMGPLENGLLYVRQEHIDKVWPATIGGGWHEGARTVDEKICFLGQRNETTTAALPEVVRFHSTIGKVNIENRVRALSSYLKAELQKKVPGAIINTPLTAELSVGVVVVHIQGKEPRDLSQKLYDAYGIASAPAGGVRFSPHIYNTIADLDKIVSALGQLARA
jgi:isopenicillin-N epimerase